MATTYQVNVSITDGDNTMTVSNGSILNGSENLKNTITNILENEKDGILNKFPTNQWIYQWIISSNIDGSLESFFTDFNVTGHRNLIDALLQDSPMSGLVPGDYVIAFEGY